MQSIRQTQALNKAELENCTPSSASWHRDYADTAFIYIGGLDTQLSEGDVITIFSQYGEPVFLNLVRDKETGKSKGFAYLKYEDQRSCDLAVDNLGGASVLGRLLNVDHTRYKKKDDEVVKDNTWEFGHQKPREHSSKDQGRKQVRDDDTDAEDGASEKRNSSRERRPRSRKLLKEEEELEEMLRDEENDDPMRAYFIEKKREEVERAHKRQSGQSSRRHQGRHQRDDESRDKDRERRRRSEHEGSGRDKESGQDKESSRRHRSRSPERRTKSRSS